MDNFIVVENNGQLIESTNYWETSNAKSGFVFVSINAGAYRVLVPDSQVAFIEDMKTAKNVVITRGPWAEKNRLDAFELLFDDMSKSPFVIMLERQQWDRIPSDADLGWKGVVYIYTSKQRDPVLMFNKVFYRKDRIPCLKPAI